MVVRKNRHIVKVISVIFIMFCQVNQLFSQNINDSIIPYTPDFEFEEGIYLNFDMVKNNHPVSKASILANVGYDDRDFFEQVLEKPEVQFYDEYGVKRTVKTSKIWGFSKNGTLYINFNNRFNRISVVGQITFFVANLTSYSNAYDPYYYNPYSYNRYGTYYNSQPTTELKQYLMDWESGEIYDFDVKSIEILLMDDPELHDEFQQLRRRKKKQLKFYYLRKFNERNKLYLPKKELI